MRNENLEQDLGWSPKQYPGYNQFDTGEWRIVAEGDVLTAVIYTNYTTSAGVSWLKQTGTVMEMRKLFLAGAETGMSPRDAYGAVESKFATVLRPVSTGTLDGLDDTLREMMTRSS